MFLDLSYTMGGPGGNNYPWGGGHHPVCFCEKGNCFVSKLSSVLRQFSFSAFSHLDTVNLKTKQKINNNGKLNDNNADVEY